MACIAKCTYGFVSAGYRVSFVTLTIAVAAAAAVVIVAMTTPRSHVTAGVHPMTHGG